MEASLLDANGLFNLLDYVLNLILRELSGLSLRVQLNAFTQSFFVVDEQRDLEPLGDALVLIQVVGEHTRLVIL